MQTNYPTRDLDMRNPEDDAQLTDSEKKTIWNPPGKPAIDKVLGEQTVRMRMPKIFYSQFDEGFRALVRMTAQFTDALMEKYEVFLIDDDVVKIRAYPQNDDPFVITIMEGKIVDLLPTFEKYIHTQRNEATSGMTSTRQELRGLIDDNGELPIINSAGRDDQNGISDGGK